MVIIINNTVIMKAAMRIKFSNNFKEGRAVLQKIHSKYEVKQNVFHAETSL